MPRKPGKKAAYADLVNKMSALLINTEKERIFTDIKNESSDLCRSVLFGVRFFYFRKRKT